jgi:hypothetical protein
MKNWPKWLWPVTIGVVVFVLVVVALVREPVQLDPATPEGTVQQYLQAISGGDFDAARELLDPESFDGCTAADIQRSVWEENFTASLPTEPGDHSGERALVEVTMRFGSGGVLGGGWESQELFVLVDRDGLWRIAEDPWPYFGWDCREEDF